MVFIATSVSKWTNPFVNACLHSLALAATNPLRELHSLTLLATLNFSGTTFRLGSL